MSTRDVKCAGAPNGWGGNYVWPPPQGLMRQPCGWDGPADQAAYDGIACPRCGGRVEERVTGRSERNP